MVIPEYEDFRKKNSSSRLRALRIHALALSFVLLLSSLIILPSASYFFQGDSLYWMEHRYQSWSEVAQAFVSLDSHAGTGLFRIVHSESVLPHIRDGSRSLPLACLWALLACMSARVPGLLEKGPTLHRLKAVDSTCD